MHESKAGLDEIKSFETFVPYLYDDLVPMRHFPGEAAPRYPEWNGGPLRGTLSIGYGHTASASYKLDMKPGLRITEAHALQILDVDLDRHEARVARMIKVPLAQGQFDALVSFDYNCGKLESLAPLINANRYDAVPAKMSLFVYSKGQRLRGLERRRRAEIALWNSDPAPDDASGAGTESISPVDAIDAGPPPKSLVESKTAWAAGTAAALETAKTVNDVASQATDTVGTAKETVQSLGLLDVIQHVVTQPAFLIAVAVIGLAAFIIWDRHRKLTKELV